MKAIRAIEEIITRDVGNRGIAAITLPDQLGPAAQNFLTAKAVVILTGFPCRMKDSPPTETDGPPGAIALARAARKLGKKAAIATDTTSGSVMDACAAAAGLKSDPQFTLLQYAPLPEPTSPDRAAAADSLRKALESVAGEYDHTVAIERAGQAADGSFYTMRGFCMDAFVAPLDPLLTIGVSTDGSRTSTGIGDGGNEAGMGLVFDAIRKNIPNGEKIACATAAGHLVTAGVSNWGGWGLVGAVEAILREQGKSVPEGALLPTEEEERRLADAMIASGARDGITGEMDGSVDGMPLERHLEVLASLRNAAAGVE